MVSRLPRKPNREMRGTRKPSTEYLNTPPLIIAATRTEREEEITREREREREKVKKKRDREREREREKEKKKEIEREREREGESKRVAHVLKKHMCKTSMT
jgi:hypothetical protein